MFIQVESLKKSYITGEIKTEVLKGIGMKLDKGETGVILGPSGSGKSTLMNIIGGIDRSDSGKVLVDNVDLTLMNDNKLTDYRRDQVGFIFQFYNLIPNLTVGENIEVVSIARSVVKNPKLLLCDEPTGALDFSTSQDILKLIQQINKDYGATILMITHNTAISAMANRIYKVRNGEISKLVV